MKRLMVAAMVVCALPLAAQADWIDLPVKWSQPIVVRDDPNGTGGPVIVGVDWASNCILNDVMADDFICDIPDPILAIRWWGSYLSDQPGVVREGMPGFAVGPFDISFHLSLSPMGPGVDPHPFSVPGPLVYLNPAMAQEVFVGFDEGGSAVYEYNAYIEPFDQWQYAHDVTHTNQIPGELFLDICKPSEEEMWGWHETRPNPILDFAWILSSDHMTPIHQTETDMAFELMVPEPATMSLLGLGIVGLVLRRRKR